MANTTDKSILTAAGKALLAQLNAEEKPLIIDKMIFANVPNRPEYPQPDDVVPTDHVVHQEGVDQRGRLSADSVIYSTTLTSGVGPFDFNWTGAYCSEYGVLVTIDHHALTPKTADQPGVAGNTLVRSVVLEYKDIAEITNITVDASTWQYNAAPRMKKMDDDVAQAIIDQNGKDWFIENGFLVTPQSTAFNIKAGAGYVSGNRVTLDFDRNVQVPNKPSFIYVNAHREGTPTGEQVTLFDFVVTAEEKDDYTDANGVKHFVCKIAQVLADGSVSDLRLEGESATRKYTQLIGNTVSSYAVGRNVYPKDPLVSVKAGDVLPVGTEALQKNGKIFVEWDLLPDKSVKVKSFVIDSHYDAAILTTEDEDTFEFVTQTVFDERKSNFARGYGLIPEVDKPVINQTVYFNRVRDEAKKQRVTMLVDAGRYLIDAMDLKSMNVAGMRGKGIESTTFYAAKDIPSGVFLDCGYSGGDHDDPDSDIQHANIGDFSIRCDDRDVEWGASFNNYRRGNVSKIRIFGARKSYRYAYSWLGIFSHLFSEEHKEAGHVFTGTSTNALFLKNLVATTSVPGAVNYVYENPYNIVMMSPDSEGSGAGIGYEFKNGRAVTFIGTHIEGAGSRFKTTNTASNGLSINIIGGAAFKCPECIEFSRKFQALTINGFSLHQVGSDFSSVQLITNAKIVVINNLSIFDDNKNAMPRDEIIALLQSGAGLNVSVISLDGEMIWNNGTPVLNTESDRGFDFTTTPGTPKIIETRKGMTRKAFRVMVTQRMNSDMNAVVQWTGVVSDNGVLAVKQDVEINNATAGITLGYNNSEDRLSIDSSYPTVTKVLIEYI